MIGLLGIRFAALAVTLSVPGHSFSAGRQITATLHNDSATAVEVAECPTLARLTDDGWATVTETHGVNVACPGSDPAGERIPAHGRERVEIEIYDDLSPGLYRVTLPYRRATTATTQPPFSDTSDEFTTTSFSVTPFDPGPAPHLSPARLLRIAMRAASARGDAHPKLIQVAEGSRLLANQVANGDLVFAWNWSYLIAIDGHFPPPHFRSPPGITLGPGPVVFPYSVVTLVVNARTGQVTDSGGSDHYPKLARLGTVTTLSG